MMSCLDVVGGCTIVGQTVTISLFASVTADTAFNVVIVVFSKLATLH